MAPLKRDAIYRPAEGSHNSSQVTRVRLFWTIREVWCRHWHTTACGLVAAGLRVGTTSGYAPVGRGTEYAAKRAAGGLAGSGKEA